MEDWTNEFDIELGDELAWDPMRLVPPDPWVGHLPFAFWLIKALRPQTLVELGTHSGNSYFAFCQAMAIAAPASRAYAVDTWEGDEHAGFYAENIFADVAAFNYRHFRQFSTLLRTTFDSARTYFPDACIDLLHIDGMHTYDAVKHDFETWQSALSQNAVVIFHDTNVRERDFGVWRLWRELTEQYPSFEFSHSNGLGILGVGSNQTAHLRALFALDGTPDRAASFRNRIAARGEAFQRQVEIMVLRQQLREAIENGQKETAAARSQLVDANHHIEELLSQLQAASHAVETSKAEITSELNAQINWRDVLLNTRVEVIHAKDAMLASVENTSAARAEALNARDRLLAVRDATISQLFGDLRTQRQQYEERLHQADAERELMRSEMLEAANAAVDSANHATVQALQLLRLESQITLERHHAATVEAYVNSTSWRLTRPVRLIARLLKKGHVASVPSHTAEPLPPPASIAVHTAELGQLPAPEPILALSSDKGSILKTVFRSAALAKLQAFLAGPENLVLPRSDEPALSIILVLYNQAELTYACLGSIIETLGSGETATEIVIVDNNSEDLTGPLLDRIEGATILRNAANLHFLKAVNQAARVARGKNLLLLNNDAQLLPGSVASALKTLESDEMIGAVGGRIILLDGTLQEAGSIIWQDGACSGYGRGEDPNSPDFMFQRDVDYCSGAFLLTPKALFEEMGGFDERFAPAYYEETDYCVRLWESGRRVVFDPDVAIVHFEFGSASNSKDALALQATNHQIFVAQHRAWLAQQWPASPANLIAARTARSRALRLLILEDRVPKTELGTGYPRANRLIQELINAGVQVAFFPMFRFEETWHGVRKALDKRVEVLIAAEAAQIRDYLVARRGHFDAILICRPPNMETFLKAVGFDQNLIGDAAILYDAEALFATRTLQRLKAEGIEVSDLEKHRMIASEVVLTRTANAVISVSPAEQNLLEDYGAQNIHLLGHALEDDPLGTSFEERDQIVFLGAIQADDAPNADAVRWFATDILPIIRRSLDQDFRLTVIGQNKVETITALQDSALDLMGMVDDLRPALARARVLVVPTRFAAGIPHKVHQAAMLGIPMVVTDLIAEQVGWQNDQQVLVASDAADFADACVRLYKDKGLWERVREKALRAVQQECAPEVFTKHVREILTEVPLVRRFPDGGPPPAPSSAPAKPSDPNTSRPANVDFSASLPFGFPPLPGQPRIGVMCHLFHTDFAPEVLFYLRHLPLPADLFLTTDTEEKQNFLKTLFKGWEKGTVEIKIVLNRGRDIAPKLIAFADAYERYDLVLHLHSKISTHAAFLAPWRSFLFENLLGTPAIIESILDAFQRLPDLGIVAPQHYEGIRRWLGWNGNFDQAKSLAARMGISLSPKRALDFPSGSMFWARPAALRPLLDLNLSFDEFPAEGDQVDHTPAHAIERLFFYVCERSGHSWLKVAQPALYWDTSTITEIATPVALSQFVARRGIMLSGSAPIACRDDPALMQTRVPPGLTLRLAARGF